MDAPRSPLFPALFALALVAATALFLAPGRPAGAYSQYSIDGASGNCADCHDDFRAGSYVSAHDLKPWNTSLHDGHRTKMLSGDCGTCHGSSRFPVILNQSDGGTGFAPIGCVGCHGRAETAAAGAVKGSGLRQHHWRNGVTVCGNAGCHADANPGLFTVVGENVPPPYYFTPDAAHPDKPTDPCNANGSESAVAPTLGLDNDGDNVYDTADPNCSTTGVGDDVVLGFALGGAFPNPSRGMLRVLISLPDARPAVLEVLDVRGRPLAARSVGELGAGRHVVRLAPEKPVPPGVYLLRLTREGRALATKVTLTR